LKKRERKGKGPKSTFTKLVLCTRKKKKTGHGKYTGKKPNGRTRTLTGRKLRFKGNVWGHHREDRTKVAVPKFSGGGGEGTIGKGEGGGLDSRSTGFTAGRGEEGGQDGKAKKSPQDSEGVVLEKWEYIPNRGGGGKKRRRETPKIKKTSFLVKKKG